MSFSGSWTSRWLPEVSSSSSGTPDPYDVVIIGGGPGGTTAAIYAARSNLRTLLVDKVHLGGQMVFTEKIANYPGCPEPISGRDLLESMRCQAERHGAEFLVSEVMGLDIRGDLKSVHCYHGLFQARTVVIATGAGERKAKVPGEAEFLGRGVSYCATCDGPFFKGDEVAVVGESVEAAEEALYLSRFAGRVHILTPRSGLQGVDHLAAEIASQPEIVIHPNQRVKRVVGETAVTGLECQVRDGPPEVLPVAGAFFYLLGAQPATSFLHAALQLDEKGYLLVDETMMTSVPGVYAVGDVRHGVLKQVVTAAADGAVAAMAAERHIRGRATIIRTPR